MNTLTLSMSTINQCSAREQQEIGGFYRMERINATLVNDLHDSTATLHLDEDDPASPG
jgi:hypothetical protein